jgi:hypothetical protein
MSRRRAGDYYYGVGDLHKFMGLAGGPGFGSAKVTASVIDGEERKT